MSVESTIFDLLKTLVSNRVYPDVAPESVTRPYITYQQVGGETVAYLENAVADHKNGRFQINVWGDLRSTVSALALQAEQAFIESTALQCRPIGAPVSTHEPETKLYGSRQDFSVWSSR